MFIYSGQWQESQVFHSTERHHRSQLLHKARSVGQSKRNGGAAGEDIHCTLSSPTPVSLRRKELMTKEQTGGESSYSNTKEHVQIVPASRHCAPIFTVVVTGRRAASWQDHPFEICSVQGKQSQCYGKGLIKTGGVWERRGEEAGPADTRMEWEINHCRQVHNQVLAIGAHSLTHCESSGTVPLSKTNASHTQTTLKGLHVLRTSFAWSTPYGGNI